MSPAKRNLVSHADLAALNQQLSAAKADMPEMQTSDLKSELEAAQQLSLWGMVYGLGVSVAWPVVSA